jgi:hypothetical protein
VLLQFPRLFGEALGELMFGTLQHFQNFQSGKKIGIFDLAIAGQNFSGSKVQCMLL